MFPPPKTAFHVGAPAIGPLPSISCRPQPTTNRYDAQQPHRNRRQKVKEFEPHPQTTSEAQEEFNWNGQIKRLVGLIELIELALANSSYSLGVLHALTLPP